MCIDDCARLAYAETAPSESGRFAAAFLRRALAYFERLDVRCREAGVRHLRTRPCTPRTNGMAERFIQTLQRRWAYRRPYRTSAHRTAALRAWVAEYNHRRPDRALGMRPPIARLREVRAL